MLVSLSSWLIFVSTVLGSGTPVSVPYFEDFESEPLCQSFCGAVCTLSTSGWTNEPTLDEYDWLVDSGGTPSGSTGPLVDHTLGTSEGKYLYMEASTPCGASSDEAWLTSPPIDLSTASIPFMSFWYHQYGDDIGSLHVDVIGAGGRPLEVDVIPPIIGGNALMWQQSPIFSLSAFVPQIVQIRFRGIYKSSGGFDGDMAIDDVDIFDFDLMFMDGFESNP